jgi:hypothetical protein
MSIAYEQKAATGLQELGLSTAYAQLDSASQNAAANDWSYSHFLGYLLEAELSERQKAGDCGLRLALVSPQYLV